jgi:hypothetical protein
MSIRISPIGQASVTVADNGELKFRQWHVDWSDHPNPSWNEAAAAILEWLMNRAKENPMHRAALEADPLYSFGP